MKINEELDDEMLILFAKVSILFFKSGTTLNAPAHYLIYKYLESGKEGLKNEMIAQCKFHPKINIELASQNFVSNAFNSDYFHYAFFEKKCKDMEFHDLKNLIKGKQLAQEKEHIIPTDLLRQGNEVEIQNLGFENKDDLGKHIDAYGNLISLEKSLNIKASNKDLYGKCEIYKESKIPFNRSDKLFDAKNFNKKGLIKRNERMVDQYFFKDFTAN
ncbi:Protein of uncharacterised function (DUF1524) [Helicobacter acinonychis]|uniref:GmrSD restriction endonucleases C-terminal domain-containing protein n=1 Tax=Helicobacter acinonychis (strain Sheeba) TaxID=382638 RepID=Q17YH2_HELAH|nr:conserved hypothetical protein fragment 4 [Helicobacter acinonychis str. Sheeba]STP04577.1 Protein of uncharacterised function (DUF1524) [Helicobacter acinonychis]